MTVVTVSIASFLVSCTMLLALRPFAEVVGLVDNPGGRKTHNGEVSVVGGLAMFSGLLVAAIDGMGLESAGVTLLVVAAIMVFLGALDDRFDLPAKVRLFAHSSAAVALVYGSGFLVQDLGDLLGRGNLSLESASLPFTVISIVA